MKSDAAKTRGIHYTPPALARFLANVVVEHLPLSNGPLTVLDPACGTGALLDAIGRALPPARRRKTLLAGYETDRPAVVAARRLLAGLDVRQVGIELEDFLKVAGRTAPDRFDVVIANPPYVRTQRLGARAAQQLAREFELTGRVDLYHAFVRGMARVLEPGGVLGLLTSNRFLTIRSGAALRRCLATEFNVRAVYDLGDTRLFSAAVLPVILAATKARARSSVPCTFDRVYADRSRRRDEAAAPEFPSVLDAIPDRRVSGLIRTGAGLFHIERGTLATGGKSDAWSLSTTEYDAWLATVRAHQRCTFDDVARVRVGIKTTADKVFIRASWDDLPAESRPEPELLRPLIRHFDAARWAWNEQPRDAVLYPHHSRGGKRLPVPLDRFPRARNYLEAHRERLTRRHYLAAGGRRWYEIWVPHDPAAWDGPKVVFPDISEEPKFFLDESGAVVNGDCYWITLRPSRARSWLLLMLAVANSTFITRYYDIAFHNKLYAGRRRFMTQYVKHFPLPDPDHPLSRRIVELAESLVAAPDGSPRMEDEIDALTWAAFGVRARRG